MYRKAVSTPVIFKAVAALSIAFVSSTAFAQTNVPVAERVVTRAVPEAPAAEPKENEDLEVIRPGVIASRGNFTGAASIDSSSDTKVGQKEDEKPSPIQASVQKAKGGRCDAVLTNTSEQSSYSVSFKVVGTTPRGATVLNKSYSATLPPKGSITRSMRCRDDLNMQVVLRSGTRK